MLQHKVSFFIARYSWLQTEGRYAHKVILVFIVRTISRWRLRSRKQDSGLVHKTQVSQARLNSRKQDSVFLLIVLYASANQERFDRVRSTFLIVRLRLA